MQVNPELAIGVVLHAGIRLVVEAVECATDNVIELLCIDSLSFEPLTVLDQFENVRSRSNPIGKSTSGIAGQTQESNDTRSV